MMPFHGPAKARVQLAVNVRIRNCSSCQRGIETGVTSRLILLPKSVALRTTAGVPRSVVSKKSEPARSGTMLASSLMTSAMDAPLHAAQEMPDRQDLLEPARDGQQKCVTDRSCRMQRCGAPVRRRFSAVSMYRKAQPASPGTGPAQRHPGPVQNMRAPETASPHRPRRSWSAQQAHPAGSGVARRPNVAAMAGLPKSRPQTRWSSRRRSLWTARLTVEGGLIWNRIAGPAYWIRTDFICRAAG